MGKYRLIAFDMDGTLLTSDKRIDEDTQAAIHAALQAGKIVAVSTGRNPAEIDVFKQELKEFPWIIAASGALVYENRAGERGEVLCSLPLPEREIRSIFQATADWDLMLHLLSECSIAQRDKITHMADYNMGVYKPMYERIALKVDDLPSYWEQNLFPVYKLNIYCKDPMEREKLRSLLAPLPLQLADSEVTSLECSAPGVSKALGLQTLCDRLGIPISEAIAVGDGGNDLDILRAAGLGIAMGNAGPAVRAAADRVVSDNDHGGCAEAIRILTEE